jgi:CubicO group peptidase (beta-lactamase class C family)/D-alanyl-D-alanine dipeptidase
MHALPKKFKRGWCAAVAWAWLVAASSPPVAAEEVHRPAVEGYAAIAETLSDVIRHELQDKSIPALSIALVDGDRIVWADGFGVADQSRGLPADASTVYRVGSISKLLTAIGVMQLVERGQLDLDAPLEKYLDDFRPGNPFGEPITLRQLMAHRAGLVREPPVGNYFDDARPTLAATVQSLNETQLVYRPGERTKYSNAGIGVVGYVLERTQKMPFPEYIQRSVLQPLGMQTASFVPLEQAAEHMAQGWMWSYDDRRWEAPTFLLGTNAAGNLFASVMDLARLQLALFAADDSEESRPLRRATLESMWTPQFTAPDERSGFGLGFYVSEFEGYRRIGHGGAVYGHATRFAALPDERLGVVVVANLDVANGLVDRIGDYALRLLLAARQQKELPDLDRTTAIPADRAAQLRGWYRHDAEIIEIRSWGDRVRLRHHDGLRELKARDDHFVSDDVQGRGPVVWRVDADQIIVGNTTYERIPEDWREDPPEHWRGLIGEYGWDHNTLYILEQHGQLVALIEWVFFYPLTEVDENTFRFPEEGGLYHGESLVFERDDSGRATRVVAACVEFPRRAVGTGEETFRITPAAPVEQLRRQALAAEPPVEAGEFREPELREITSLDDFIFLDIRYAGTNNFVGSVFYSQPRAFLQRPAAEAVVRVHRSLASRGFGLLIHDAYRPWYVTKMFFDATPADMKMFVADPSKGSRHNRGAAVDLTLYDLFTGEPVSMPSGYDEFSSRAFPEYPGGTTRQRWQRDLLRLHMQAEGFDVYEFEWWHFDFRDWRKYGILNKRFEELDAGQGNRNGN